MVESLKLASPTPYIFLHELLCMSPFLLQLPILNNAVCALYADVVLREKKPQVSFSNPPVAMIPQVACQDIPNICSPLSSSKK